MKRNNGGAVQRPMPVIRPTTPRSPVGGGVFESMEGSDEEDHVLLSDDEQRFLMADEEGDSGQIAPADDIPESELVRITKLICSLVMCLLR